MAWQFPFLHRNTRCAIGVGLARDGCSSAIIPRPVKLQHGRPVLAGDGQLARYGIERDRGVIVDVADEGHADDVVRAGEARDRTRNSNAPGKAKRPMGGGVIGARELDVSRWPNYRSTAVCQGGPRYDSLFSISIFKRGSLSAPSPSDPVTACCPSSAGASC
jgi:hypothetical protein